MQKGFAYTMKGHCFIWISPFEFEAEVLIGITIDAENWAADGQNSLNSDPVSASPIIRYHATLPGKSFFEQTRGYICLENLF